MVMFSLQMKRWVGVCSLASLAACLTASGSISSSRPRVAAPLFSSSAAPAAEAGMQLPAWTAAPGQPDEGTPSASLVGVLRFRDGLPIAATPQRNVALLWPPRWRLDGARILDSSGGPRTQIGAPSASAAASVQAVATRSTYTLSRRGRADGGLASRAGPRQSRVVGRVGGRHAAEGVKRHEHGPAGDHDGV